jgi:hypothetical protein
VKRCIGFYRILDATRSRSRDGIRYPRLSQREFITHYRAYGTFQSSIHLLNLATFYTHENIRDGRLLGNAQHFYLMASA